MKTIEQILQQIEVADRQIKAYTGNRHGKHNLEMARLLKASLEKELAEHLKAQEQRDND
ncbi:hypothetical protein ACSFCX_03630 [Yokenella regensburgei]|uniref:hypothetical protein n=1 Tax=Yokenella regensburgei TaxID=158877 RepID=UPI003EDAE2C9